MSIKQILFSIVILFFFGNIILAYKETHKTFYYQSQFYDFPKETSEGHLSLTRWKKMQKRLAKNLHNPPTENCTIIFNDNHPDDDRFSCCLIVCAYSNDDKDLQFAVTTELLKFKMHYN